jgi:hypothetical protein
MKSPINYSVVKTALLLASLGSFNASLTIPQARGSDLLFVSAARPGPSDNGTKSAKGYLLVYSATDEVSDGDMVFNTHSSYVIYTNDGKFVRNIENHISRSDEIPELVRLPPGDYTVEARSANNGYVRVYVLIKPGRRTVLDLDQRI